MPSLSRRLAITGVVTYLVGLIGCLRSANPLINLNARRREEFYTESDRVILLPNQMDSTILDHDFPLELEYEFAVEGDGLVDVLLLESSEYWKYQSKEEFDYLESGSTLGASSGEKTTRLEPREYHLVVDYTDRASAAIDDTENRSVTVGIDVVLYLIDDA